MTIRKRRQPTPDFRLPPPYQPITGEQASLIARGVFPYVAMMQVAAEDTHDNYVICRGFDIRFSKFFDYEDGNDDKPGIAVAKPYGLRRAGAYRIGQIHPAVLPLQSSNPSPSAVEWRTGQNPGVAETSKGHPADLDEKVDHLWDDDDEHLIAWMLLDSADCPVEMVKALECIYPGDTDKTAQPMKLNRVTRCWEEDDSKDPVTICDCNSWLLALPGECFKVERLSACDTTFVDEGSEGEEPEEECYRPSFPFGLTRRVKITELIECGACGPVKLLKTGTNATQCATPLVADVEGLGSEGSEGGDDCEITVCNSTNRRLGCDADEYATLHISPGECGTGTAPECYGWLVPNLRPMRAKAILNAKMCGTGATFDEIDEYLDVCDWEPRVEPTTAANPHGLMGCSGDEVELAWNDVLCAWDVVQVQHYAVDGFITDLGCSGECVLGATVLKSQVGVQQCENCGQTESVAVAEASWIDVVDDITGGTPGTTGQTVLTGMTSDISGGTSEGSEGGKCEFTFSSANLTSTTYTVKKKKICILCAGEDTADDGSTFDVLDIGTAGDDAKITATEVTAIHDVELNCEPCPELQAKGQTFWALCVSDADDEWADATGTCECIDCEEESA